MAQGINAVGDIITVTADGTDTGHLRSRGDHPSVLARRYRSHGHGDELSQ